MHILFLRYALLSYLGVNGIDGDGDVMRSDNQRKFREFVMENTNNKGVHFVMADGVSHR